MHTIIKLVLFGLFIYAMINGFLNLYRFLNGKIAGSQTLPGVLGVALILVLANLVLYCLGIFVFLKIYEFLSLPSA